MSMAVMLTPTLSEVLAASYPGRLHLEDAASYTGTLRRGETEPERDVYELNRTGYSGQIYERRGIRRHAEWVASKLEHLAGRFDFVVATGKSGMSVAFAALMLTDFHLVTVRKGESSHGGMIEGIAPRMDRYLVIDDLVDSGATLNRVHGELTQMTRGGRYAKPRMVGVLLYSHSGRQADGFKVSGQRGMVPAYVA